MIVLALVLLPLLSGLASFLIRQNGWRRSLLVASAGIHLLMSVGGLVYPQVMIGNRWLTLDPLGSIFLIITSVLFFGASLYAVQYLSDERHVSQDHIWKEGAFSVEAVFCGCFLLFLASLSMVMISQHLAIQWAAIEATTLASAPLIYFHRTRSSLEATWKYLLICSVGIALALLGVFLLAVAKTEVTEEMFLNELIRHAASLHLPWLQAAFLFLFVGYGTKMGLAPFHTWLPDAHSEAPSVISALLSGALLNGAFLGILRAYQIGLAAGLGQYCQEIFVVFGLISILFAAVFILGQKDFKRMLAYSSVEHMGIMTLGIGLGAGAVAGALIQMLGHSLTKAGLFLVAGNILSAHRSKKIADIRGLMQGGQRKTGILWLAGFLLITGMPPSGIFLGKFLILKEVLLQNRTATAITFLFGLGVIFIGMARIFIAMTQGAPCEKDSHPAGFQNSFLRVFPPTVFLVMSLLAGVSWPGLWTQVFTAAIAQLGGCHG